ncbi:MAG: PmoA family protein [Bacteroidales bacterium]|nr:PmoA family protein [Bacteroidales bacterium]
MKSPILLALFTTISISCTTQKQPMITVEEIAGQNKVEIKFDGQPFTSYIWPDDMEKPVLYPLRTSTGNIVTRGFPLDPRPGERVDHPHHVGHWFNYGDVNGLDFWNNSYAVPEEKKMNYGSIRHEKILKTSNREGKGILEVETSWRNFSGEILLKEVTSFVFSGNETLRTIERTTTLTAVDNPVEFKDNKEGMFGMRMDRAFEFPTDKPELFTDAEGNPTEVKVMNNEGVNGSYLSSEGLRDEEVWGTRAKWVSLSAEKEGEKISVVILDHPKNPGYPTYWHARTYGLFAANPLGQAVFSNGNEVLNFSLDAGESVTFRYMILIQSGEFARSEDLDKAFDIFAE